MGPSSQVLQQGRVELRGQGQRLGCEQLRAGHGAAKTQAVFGIVPLAPPADAALPAGDRLDQAATRLALLGFGVDPAGLGR